MELTFVTDNIIQLDDARIVYRNFAGAPSKFNREGDRNFAVVIPDEPFDREQTMSEALIEAGWNVKIKAPRNEDEEPFMTLPVKIKFNGRGPKVYLVSGSRKIELDEESVGCLDDIDILRVDMDLRAYDWDVNGKVGRTAYLQSIQVVQRVDRFAAE